MKTVFLGVDILTKYPIIINFSTTKKKTYTTRGFVNNAVDISFTWAYSNQYHFSSTLVGLFYMCGLVGTTAGSFIGGMMSDRIYMHKVESAKADDHSIFPEMRLSQLGLFIAAFIMAGSFCGYGWSIEKNIHFSAGVIFQAFGTV